MSTPVIIKGHFENTVETDDIFAALVARCDDRNTLITLEIHVNGKLKKRASGNGWVTTGDVRIKKQEAVSLKFSAESDANSSDSAFS